MPMPDGEGEIETYGCITRREAAARRTEHKGEPNHHDRID
jgi:hypothetical protein